MKYAPKDVAKLGTILGIWAHPDDEVFASGGLIASAVENGQRILIITATKGEAGGTADESRWPTEKLGEIRAAELEKSLLLLGGVEHSWLGYRDGDLLNVGLSDAVEKIVRLCDGQKIDTIVTFEEEGITGHQDHKTVYGWAVSVASKLGCDRILCAVENEEFYESFGQQLHDKYNLYFATEKPACVCRDDADVCLILPAELQEIKLQALAAHASQLSLVLSDPESMSAMRKMCECECYIKIK